MIEYLIQVIIQFRYAAVFGALSMAGLGVPVPEEATLIISGFLVATGHMEFWTAFVVCYGGVLTGDLITYMLGRYGGRLIFGSRFHRWVMTRQKLAQMQYYYRRYGPRSLLLTRQAPGIRFPSFFAAGMLRMPLGTFFAYDAMAACISMPMVFLVAYYFGPLGLRYLLDLVLTVRDVTSLVVLGFIVLALLVWLIYRYAGRRVSASSSDGPPEGEIVDEP